ncbi:neuropeptide Y receptor type 2 [Thalassophryne amazonica]|uniref:neuropeptide Y receptor type 2 n=1 Tax=Thalassophryne amazonica TaxID=390379 RepID=UPI001471AB72|nr:neuropeptide Y receptor type 2 [Thalassophryne amazonica]
MALIKCAEGAESTKVCRLSDLRGLLPMDTATLVNVTQVQAFELHVNASNSSSSTSSAIDDLSNLEDSTKLFGIQLILILAYSTIILFGVIGNSLVIYVVYTFKNLRTVTNFFIVNLAIADLLVNTLCLPFTLVYTLYGEWKFGRALCFLLPFAQGVAVHVSTITLNVIALDRYRSIVYHLESRMSKDTCTAIVVMTWALSALLASPLAIFREYGMLELTADESILVCTEKWPDGSMNGSVYSLSMLVVQYVLPLVINSVAYIGIWSKLKNCTSFGARNENQWRRKRTTEMLVTMVVVFAVSWLPLQAFQLAADIDGSILAMKDFKLLFTAFHIVAMCSTFVNPILYGWMNNNYRAAFFSVCNCKRPFDLRSKRYEVRHTQRIKACTTNI